MDNFTIIAEDFSTPLTIMDKTATKKTNKTIEDLTRKPARSNRHTQNTPQNKRIHIFLKCT